MRHFIILSAFAISALGACTPMGAPQLTAQITTQDMLMSRPNRDERDVLFRMMPNGSGSVEFLGIPSEPQPVGWSLAGSTFCIDADEGLIASFDCATLSIVGNQVTMAHTESSSVATGVLVAR